MNKKIFFLPFLVLLFPISNYLSFNSYQNKILKNNISDTQELNTNFKKDKLPIPSLDFNKLDENIKLEFSQKQASLVTYDDISRILFQSVFFRFFDIKEYDQLNDYSQLRLFNIIDENNSFNGDFNKNFNTVFNNNGEIRYNNDLGIINIRIKIKQNQKIKIAIIDDYQNIYDSKPTKKYIVDDYIEFAITNFKNKYTLLLSNQTINAVDTNLANVNANDENFSEVLKDTLFQFQDSEILPEDKRILVTNFTKHYFNVKYKPKFEVVESKFAGSQAYVKLKLDIFNQENEFKNKGFFNAKNDVLYFNIINLKNKISIEQNKIDYDISVNVNFANYTANDFIANGPDGFIKNILKLINYKDDKIVLKNPLFTTNLTRREFSSLEMWAEIGNGIDDIRGIISGSKFFVKIPFGPLETNNPQYIVKSFRFNIYNFKQNIFINSFKNTVFDVSHDAELSSISVDSFNEQKFYDSLIKYDSLSYDNNFLITTNVTKSIFKTIVKEIKITNRNKNNGELDLEICFKPIRNLPDLKILNYKLTGFLKEININQKYKTINKDFFHFLSVFNQEYIVNNQLIDDPNIKKDLKRTINSNIEQLFLFETDQLIDSKIFSVNTDQHFFITKILSSNIQIDILENLGIINIKIILNDYKGVTLNNTQISPTNAYLEFNIAGYNKQFDANIIDNFVIKNRDDLNINHSSEIDLNIICDKFFSYDKHQINNPIFETTLAIDELLNFFLQDLTIDNSGVNSLGFSYIRIEFAKELVNKNNSSIEIIINGFDQEITSNSYTLKDTNIDISNNNKFKNTKSHEFKFYNFIEEYIGFNNDQRKNKAIVFSFSKDIFLRFILINKNVEYENDKCRIEITINDKTREMRKFNFNIYGFMKEEKYWLIPVILVPILIIVILVIGLLLWLARKRRIKQINDEKMLL